MISNKVSVIHQRDHLAPISQSSPSRKINEGNCFKEYSLTQNEFDPSKCSPPNEFMLKLQLRISMYQNQPNQINNQINNNQNKVDIRVNE